MLRVIYSLTVLLICIAPAYAENFALNSLPKGKEVTLPRATVTVLPSNQRVNFASTDLPQAIKLSREGQGPAIKVAIYDQRADRVKRVEIKSGGSFLYHFRDLSMITIVPESKDVAILHVESNKPLSVSH